MIPWFVIGEQVSNYTIASRLGRSALGDLWQATAADGSRATIELLPAGPTSFANVNVEHPLLAKVLETGVHANGQPFLVLEPFGGESLEDLIQRSGRLSSTQTSDIAGKVASALHALHRANLVHRNLSANGIFIDGESVTVLDGNIRNGPTAETGMYAAPELWGNGKVDARADVYALGCITYEMATGRPPFVGATLAELPAKHRDETPPPISSLVTDVAKTLDMLVQRMMQKQPGDRPRAASELSFVFELVEGGEAVPSLGSTVKNDV